VFLSRNSIIDARLSKRRRVLVPRHGKVSLQKARRIPAGWAVDKEDERRDLSQPMATIDIRRPHQLPVQEARAKAEELARSMQEKLGIQWKWAGDRIEFDAPSGAAKGANGAVEVLSDAVRVLIDLPFLMRPMKGMIETKVRERLEKALG